MEVRNNEIPRNYKRINIINPVRFDPVDYTGSPIVGTINLKDGRILDVHTVEGDDQIVYGAFDKTVNSKYPITSRGFIKYGTGALMARSAQTQARFQKQGASSQLMYFVNKTLKHHVISDDSLTAEGEQVWQFFIRSPKFDVMIFHFPSLETFPLEDIGKATTTDGRIVISPKSDNKNAHIYSQTNPDGQRFFYIIMS